VSLAIWVMWPRIQTSYHFVGHPKPSCHVFSFPSERISGLSIHLVAQRPNLLAQYSID